MSRTQRIIAVSLAGILGMLHTSCTTDQVLASGSALAGVGAIVANQTGAKGLRTGLAIAPALAGATERVPDVARMSEVIRGDRKWIVHEKDMVGGSDSRGGVGGCARTCRESGVMQAAVHPSNVCDLGWRSEMLG